MGLQVISEAMEATRKKSLFSEEEKKFVVEFAFKTKDKELTNKLIDELGVPNKDFAAIKTKFMTMYDRKPKWLNQIENLLVALEMYRLEEEKAINRISEILKAYGTDLTAEEIKKTDISKLKEKVNKEVGL